MSKQEVRVRVAPSPTGDPHVGLGYITLFNYAFARSRGGKLVLRIEDTDQSRFQESSERDMMDSLKWLGLAWDEGPDCGGDYGPYRQSERTQIYQDHAARLIESGHAYRCLCTAERLDELRLQQKQAKQTTRYDGHCRELVEADKQQAIDSGQPYVVRLKMPREGTSTFEDALRGEVSFDFERLDDQVIIKSDGFPTYHLANVVDDHLMKITHVIRAEEWINSTPKHTMLYQAFGWTPPVFVHMPLIRNADRSKISKRKNPVSLLYYRQAGYLPRAMVNFFALMGWSFGDDTEVFSLADMVDRFELDSIHLGGPVFDLDKLRWLNAHYLRELSAQDFATHLLSNVFTHERLQAMQPLASPRMETMAQFVPNNSFFFADELSLSPEELLSKGVEPAEQRRIFASLLERLDQHYDWRTESLDALLKSHLAELEVKARAYFMPIRIAVTGRKDSPPLPDTLAVLGREMVRHRLRTAIKLLT